MGFLSVLSMAHRWIAERTQPGDVVIDATAGNGVDTLALAQLVGPRGTVYAFDVQQQALEATEARLSALSAEDKLPSLRLLLHSHEEMDKLVDADHIGRAAAIMFNLGYLPGGDASLITQPSSTLAALDAALAILRPGGIVTCVLYPGHPGGNEEAAAVEGWACSLPRVAGQAVVYRQLQRQTAPYLVAVEKKRQPD
ncbi:class I SAM-dependent methyltransferase [Paenibacillus sp. GCM10023252]|uniref:class I SAM-dependent methyltransferase n=1 Tax=Paenibacillus sp. GCM10023252 TaxID=3252649 RepID=UPI00360E3F84